MTFKKGNNEGFKKGQSGNPGGRPKRTPELREIALAACPQAIRALIAQLKDPDPKIVANAASLLLDRGMGRPMQAHEVTTQTEVTLIETRNLNIKAWMDETAREIGLVQWEREEEEKKDQVQ